MKLIKWSLMAAAILLGIGGAFLTRPNTNNAKTIQHFSAAPGCVWNKTDQPANSSDE